MVTVFVALGANLQQPQQQIMQAAQALATLAEGDSFKLSPCYRSVPMGDVEQPDYVNAVACLIHPSPRLSYLMLCKPSKIIRSSSHSPLGTAHFRS